MFGISDDTAKVIGSGLAALIAGLFGRSFFKRRWSRERVDQAEDQASIDLLARVIQERKEWHNREDELLKKLDQTAGVREELAAARVEIRRLTERIEELKSLLKQSGHPV